jgi:hypothetical protein
MVLLHSNSLCSGWHTSSERKPLDIFRLHAMEIVLPSCHGMLLAVTIALYTSGQLCMVPAHVYMKKRLHCEDAQHWQPLLTASLWLLYMSITKVYVFLLLQSRPNMHNAKKMFHISSIFCSNMATSAFTGLIVGTHQSYFPIQRVLCIHLLHLYFSCIAKWNISLWNFPDDNFNRLLKYPYYLGYWLNVIMVHGMSDGSIIKLLYGGSAGLCLLCNETILMQFVGRTNKSWLDLSVAVFKYPLR